MNVILIVPRKSSDCARSELLVLPRRQPSSLQAGKRREEPMKALVTLLDRNLGRCMLCMQKAFVASMAVGVAAAIFVWINGVNRVGLVVLLVALASRRFGSATSLRMRFGLSAAARLSAHAARRFRPIRRADPVGVRSRLNSLGCSQPQPLPRRRCRAALPGRAATVRNADPINTAVLQPTAPAAAFR